MVSRFLHCGLMLDFKNWTVWSFLLLFIYFHLDSDSNLTIVYQTVPLKDVVHLG